MPINELQSLNYTGKSPTQGRASPHNAGTIVGLGIIGAMGEAIASNTTVVSNNDPKHTHKQNQLEKIKEFILASVPFANEVANVLAHLDDSPKWCLKWLYESAPESLLSRISKYTIDFFALLSMVGNGINKFHEYLEKGTGPFVSSIMGLWESSLFLVFSYIIPSFSIEAIQHSLGKKIPSLNGRMGRFFTGIVVGIGSLELGVRLCSKFLTPYIEKLAYKLQNIFEGFNKSKNQV